MDRSKGKAEGPAAKEASDPDLEGNPEADSFGAEWTSPSTKNLPYLIRQVFCCSRKPSDFTLTGRVSEAWIEAKAKHKARQQRKLQIPISKEIQKRIHSVRNGRRQARRTCRIKYGRFFVVPGSQATSL
ncbi:hypothetical protein ACFSL6_24205 [Paenibacillus thailandensis]|uniref:Uncharacterized protein n=1 Tax=Paenibacillus thailandensis TaxID=393250 RepID=A0ABW5R338_9BACL